MHSPWYCYHAGLLSVLYYNVEKAENYLLTAERRHDIIKRNSNNLIPYLLQDSAEYKKLDLEGNI